MLITIHTWHENKIMIDKTLACALSFLIIVKSLLDGLLACELAYAPLIPSTFLDLPLFALGGLDIIGFLHVPLLCPYLRQFEHCI